jgi:hypothetical protein
MRIRANLRLAAEDVLLVCLDEIVRLGNPALRGPTLTAAMRVMDTCRVDPSKGRTIFIFSALTKTDVEAWRGNTGRKLVGKGMHLPLLAQEDVDAVVLEEAGDAKVLLDRPIIRTMLLQCAGHPRTVFEWFVPALKALYHDYQEGHIPASAVAIHVAHASMDLAVSNTLTSTQVRTILDPTAELERNKLEELQCSGVAVLGTPTTI